MVNKDVYILFSHARKRFYERIVYRLRSLADPLKLCDGSNCGCRRPLNIALTSSLCDHHTLACIAVDDSLNVIFNEID